MKKHFIHIIIVILLALTGVLLGMAADLWATSFSLSGAGTIQLIEFALGIAAVVPVPYGLAVTLMILLNQKKWFVHRVWSWLGCLAFAIAMVCVILTTVSYYCLSRKDIGPWMLVSWAVTGLLLPFFVSSVSHLKAPVQSNGKEI